ncbi:Siroheme synthase / Precorrin-2 oxidase / Sirohydrochlorin ferrochelatase [hydrothermal vent metagenome]|uniref:precorrin-2 dehydrogenase n=1 Tax=hydrothermal vent metagenome TaxID=652676 RepID=A0A1W1CCB6_9ZZZZ
MAFFPMYMDMSSLKVLLVGGGAIATEKLEKLVDFTKEITIITKELSSEADIIIRDNGLTLHQRAYRQGDLDGFDIVIVATDGVELHKSIYEESRGSRVLVNSVDDTAYCDFIFPSYIKRGDLTISFSTSGASPAFAKQIKAYFQNTIPDNIDEFLSEMKRLRGVLPKGKERMSRFEEMVREYISKNFK